jgi:PST family polysaccharide transporter
VNKEVAKNFFKFTAMALTSAVCVPISHILVRNHLGATLGWEAAGYWEAMWRLSAAYLMLVTTTLSVYYLPKLSELTHQSEIKDEILQGYKFILPCAAVCGLLMYVLRDFIIQVLFTADFLPMRNLFAWQIVGDTLKIGSWILAYVMLGKAMFKLFIASEIFSAISFYVLTVILTKYMGLEGVSLAHALNYAIYWFMMILFVTSALKRMKPETLTG